MSHALHLRTTRCQDSCTVTAVTLALAFAHPSSATVSSTLQGALAEEHLHLFRPSASLLHKSIPTAACTRPCMRICSSTSPLPPPVPTLTFYTAGG